MKKLFYLFIFIFSYTTIANAQLDINYGIKAGLNYNSNGDLSISGGLAGINESIDSQKEVGSHLGIYSQLNFNKFYVKPELVYTRTKSTYNGNFSSLEFKLSTLELPVLIGYKVVKPISVYVGPSFQYILDTDFLPSFDLNIENDIVLRLNIGITLNISKFGIDLRYTTEISENLAVNFNNLPFDGLGYSIDTKSKQLVMSISYQIN